jgi:hypothetical protein
LGPARAKAIAAQDRTPNLWLEWDAVRFAALIANNLESLTFVAAATTTATCLLWSAKGGAARITTWFAAFRVTQAPLTIVFLFSFSKWEGSPTLGASDVQIRH